VAGSRENESRGSHFRKKDRYGILMIPT
jgi:hypothetical protein